jgi:hypothetical protein
VRTCSEQELNLIWYTIKERENTFSRPCFERVSFVGDSMHGVGGALKLISINKLLCALFTGGLRHKIEQFSSQFTVSIRYSVIDILLK